MKKTFTILLLLICTFALNAQSNYSSCYTENMKKGNTAFSKGHYGEAKTYYATAKKCDGGNPAEAQKKIASCDAKIKSAREAAERAEEQARLEREARERAAEQARLEQEERQRQEKKKQEQAEADKKEKANRRQGYMKNPTIEFASVNASGDVLVSYGGTLTNLKMDRLQPRLKFEILDANPHTINVTTKLKYNGNTDEKNERVEISIFDDEYLMEEWRNLKPGNYVYEIWFEGQKLCSSSFSITVEEVSISANVNTKEVNSRRNECIIYVNTNVLDYEVSTPEWCYVREKTPEKFTIVFYDNNSTAAREGSCTLYARDKNCTIRLIQHGSDPFISIDKTFYNFSSSAETIHIPVSTNLNWNIYGGKKWCQTYKNTSEIILSVKRNRGAAKRKSSFLVKAYDINNRNFKEIPISVIQNKKTHTKKYIDPGDFWFTLNGGSGSSGFEYGFTFGHVPTRIFGYYIQGASNIIISADCYYDVQAGITLGREFLWKFGGGYRHFLFSDETHHLHNLDATLGFAWRISHRFVLGMDATAVIPDFTQIDNLGFTFRLGLGWYFDS